MPLATTPPTPPSTNPHCPNCYYPHPGDYCPQCGQKQAERRITMRALLLEFFDEHFGVNRRLPRTLRTLLFKPGMLTREHFEGRIQQYIGPFKLYLVTSLLFFAVFSLSQSSESSIRTAAEEVRRDMAEDTSYQRRIQADADTGKTFVGVRFDPTDTINYLEDPEINLFLPALNGAAERRMKQYAQFGEVEGTQRMLRDVLRQLATVVFFLLPFYAFLLWLFFRRQRPYYVEHFTFALHLHAFGFLAILPTAILGLPVFSPVVHSVGNGLSRIILIWVLIYVYLAMRRVYQQGRLLTGVKFFALTVLYGLNLGIGIVMSFVLALTIG